MHNQFHILKKNSNESIEKGFLIHMSILLSICGKRKFKEFNFPKTQTFSLTRTLDFAEEAHRRHYIPPPSPVDWYIHITQVPLSIKLHTYTTQSGNKNKSVSDTYKKSRGV